MWFWVIAILGIGRRLLFFSSPILQYVAEATYPFYILHMTVIVLIGFPVMNWEAGMAWRYLFVVIASILGTILIYELFVRRWGIARFLFGLKPRT
jgi:peptidoglycan/LPS O-acetylase OafA/YrhL